MQKLPIIFGYAGTLPFIFLMLLSLIAKDSEDIFVITVMNIGYAAMILSFLAGTHWTQSLKTQNKIQLTFSMLPSILGFVLLGCTVWFETQSPLLFAAILFWVVYCADTKFLSAASMPEGYFTFRRNLTVIVSLSLGISFLANLL